MQTVRTTFEPEREIEVTDREAAELESQGLLVKTSAKTDEGARRAAVRQTEKETA